MKSKNEFRMSEKNIQEEKYISDCGTKVCNIYLENISGKDKKKITHTQEKSKYMYKKKGMNYNPKTTPFHQ